MLSLVGGELYQWDTGRIVKVVPDEDVTVHEVHFSTKRMDYAYVLKTYTEEGVTYCAIPNIILQQTSRLLCYEVCENSDGEETIAEATFNITKRNRPEDYVYTEQEHLTVVSLENRLAKVEESAHIHKNKTQLDTITEEDLETWRNPITTVVQYTEQTLTEEQKLQARANIDTVGPYFDWTPITFSYTPLPSHPQFVSTATVYVGRGTLFPVDMAAATDELQEAWRKFQSVRLNGFGTTTEQTLEALQYVYMLCQNGVFGENFTTDGAENRTIVLGSINKTGGYYKLNSELTIQSYTASGLDWLTVVFTTNLKSQSIRYDPRKKTIVFSDFYQSLRTYASEKSISSPSLSQILMSAAPTEEMHIATKKYVDENLEDYAKKTDISTVQPDDALLNLSELGIITPAFQDDVFYTATTGEIYVL